MFALFPSVKFSSSTVIQNGVGCRSKKTMGFTAQSPQPDTFSLKGLPDASRLALASTAFDKSICFAGGHSRPHPQFPQVKVLQPVLDPSKETEQSGETKEMEIGQMTILDKERHPIRATVTSQWEKDTLYSKGKPVELAYEKIRVKTQKTNPKTGVPEDYLAGWMQLRFFLNRPDKYNLEVQQLITNHEDFHGIGTALMRLAMQRHLLFQDCEWPIRLGAVKNYYGHVEVSRSQRKLDDATSPVFFYRKLGFQLEHPDVRVQTDPYTHPERCFLLGELLENGHAVGNNADAQAWRNAIPIGIGMYLDKEQFEKRHLPTLWQEPMNLVAFPEAWIK